MRVPSLWTKSIAFRNRLEPNNLIPGPNFDQDSARSLRNEPQSMLEDLEVMRSSARNLAALRNLPSTALVLLLTPVLTPAKTESPRSRDDPVDPFEAFGRELSKSHPRIRHVPYVPKHGITQTHISFLSQAAAIIVVVCESSIVRHESFQRQIAFAESVAGARQAQADPEKVPLVLMRFDENKEAMDVDEYETVLRASSVTGLNATKASQVLFKTDA